MPVNKYDLGYYREGDKPKVICLGSICVFQHARRASSHIPFPDSLPLKTELADDGFLEKFLCYNFDLPIQTVFGSVPELIGGPEVGYGPGNGAVCLRKLGFDVKVITTVGDDVLGKISKELLAQQHINTSLISTCDDGITTPQALCIHHLGPRRVVPTQDFERRALLMSVERKPKVDLHRIITNQRYIQAIKEAKGIFIANLDVSYDELVRFLTWVRKINPFIVIAFNPKQKQQEGWSIAELSSISSKVTILTLHRSGAAMILGTPEEKRKDASMEELVQRIYTGKFMGNPKIVMLTDGSAGSIAYDGHDLFRVGAKYICNWLNFAGAGDAFESTFFGSYICCPEDIESALLRAATNAANVGRDYSTQKSLLASQHLDDASLSPPI